MTKISVYIIAYNEAGKIGPAINSVLWADEIVVVDSHSKDGTARIATSMGARVVQVEFHGFGGLRNQAINACSHEWIFSLDADERCPPETRDEILSIVDSAEYDTYFIPRKNFFMGKWISYSGFYPDYRQPQLFRKGTLVFQPDPVHERYTIISEKPAGFLKNPIWQEPYRNLGEVQHKANRYSALGADKLAKAGMRGSMGKALGHALWAFLQLYILKRGILDGWPGFVIALGNFEGTFYKYAKLYEMQSGWKSPDSPPLRRK